LRGFFIGKKMKKSDLIGFAIAITGVLLFSAKAVLVKLCYEFRVDTISVLMLRMSFSLPVFIIIGLFKSEKGKEPLTIKSFLWLVGFGVLGYYGASYFDFQGLQYIDASLERLILFVYPTIVVLLSALVLKSKLEGKQFIAIAITYIGLLVIFLPNFIVTDVEVSVLGIVLILLSALTYASYLVASQFFVPKFGTVRFTTYAMVISCVVVMIHYFLDEDASVIGLHWKVYLYGFLMAIFCTVIPSYLISEGIKRINASRVAIIGSLGPVSTISLSILLLGESLNMYQVLGGVVIVSGVVWLNLQKNK